MMATMPLPIATGSMSARTVPASCSARSRSAHALRSSVERGDLEHPVGDVGLEAGEQPPGERMALDRADEREEQRLAPVGQVGLVERRSTALRG